MMEGSEFWYLTSEGEKRLERLELEFKEENIDYKILNYMRDGESKSLDEISDYLQLKPVVVRGMLNTMAKYPHIWVIKESKYDLLDKGLAPYWDEENAPMSPRILEGYSRLGGERRSDLEIPPKDDYDSWQAPFKN